MTRREERCSSMPWNGDECVCSDSMDQKMDESKCGIAMVCNPCAFEDEFSVRICDCRSTRGVRKLVDLPFILGHFTLPQKRHRCALRCLPS